MNTPAGVNPIYARAEIALGTPPWDLSQRVIDETEKTVLDPRPSASVQLARRMATTWLLLTLVVGGFTTVGTTYGAATDFHTSPLQAGAGVWSVDVTMRVHPTVHPPSGGLTPVTVFKSDSFDPSTINPSTVCFGSAASPTTLVCGAAHAPIVQGSGDVKFHFDTSDAGFTLGDEKAILRAKTYSGMTVWASDLVETAPPIPLSSAHTLRLAPAPAPTGGGELTPSPVAEPETSVVSEPESDTSVIPELAPETGAVQEPAPQKETESASDAVVETAPRVEPPVTEPDSQPTQTEAEPAEVGEPIAETPVEQAEPVEPVVVPDLVNLSVRQATRQVLETAGVPVDQIDAAIEGVDSVATANDLLHKLCGALLCAGAAFEEQETDAHEPGTVIDQSQPVDAKWAEADTLTLLVAVAPPPPVDVESADDASPADPPAEPPAEQTAGTEATELKTTVVQEPPMEDAGLDGGQP